MPQIFIGETHVGGYDDLVLDLPPLAWNGGTGTLFAYGQTGSGKTFTVSRLEERVVQALMRGTLPGERQILMTMVELAGNSAFDLLHSRRPVSILEDSLGVTQLSGADEHLVEDEAEAMRLIKKATFFRRTAPTRKNDGSSRSHGICRIRIADPATGSDGLLYLVDLAGSEAARDVAVHGADRMRETREINISLSVLKDCIRAKAQADVASRRPKKTHVPFRQSALTKVLKHVFDPPAGRPCKTVVIACVNPSLGDAGASKNTLRYAEMLRVVLPATAKKPHSALVAPGAWSNAQLQDWISKNVSRAPFRNSDATDTAVTPPSSQSGASPILPSVVAPTETGSQFLRLPADNIELRCVQCPGVTTEEAQAFRSKLWQLHVDSQRLGYLPAAPSESPVIRLSSRDPDPQVAGVPFRQRIRPGMAVKWHPASDRALPASLALILSPRDGDGTAKAGSCSQYLCASVTPGLTPGAYEVNLWHQILVDVDAMEHEVILEYDTATRYYHLSI